MGDYERRQSGFADSEQPEEVILDDNHRLHLSPIGTHTVDIRHLPRPLATIDEEPEVGITVGERKVRDMYIASCKETYSALWEGMEMFITSTSIDEAAALDESAIFYMRLAFNELIQNAFRYGGRPQRLLVSLVRATDAYSLIPRLPLPEECNMQLKQLPHAASVGENRILLGVQDAIPAWKEQQEANDDGLLEHLRGLDIIRGISKAVWYKTHESPSPSKWVWTLI